MERRQLHRYAGRRLRRAKNNSTKAVETAEKAVKLADEDKVQIYKDRLALYKQKKPFFGTAGKSVDSDAK